MQITADSEPTAWPGVLCGRLRWITALSRECSPLLSSSIATCARIKPPSIMSAYGSRRFRSIPATSSSPFQGPTAFLDPSVPAAVPDTCMHARARKMACWGSAVLWAPRADCADQGPAAAAGEATAGEVTRGCACAPASPAGPLARQVTRGWRGDQLCLPPQRLGSVLEPRACGRGRPLVPRGEADPRPPARAARRVG